jgi:mxaL protein
VNPTTVSRLVHYLPVAACVLILIACLLPPIARQASVYRYLLVFDISQSMDVEDAQLDGERRSRFQLSKAAAQALIGSLPCGSEVGLAVFAATRTVTLLTNLEVCEHYNGLLVSLDLIDGRMRFKNASSIGKGLHQSLRAASSIGNDTAVVMFTDGHEAPPLRNGQTGMPKSEGHDVEGYIIGVGSDALSRIPRVDNNGRSLGFWQAEDVTQLPLDDGTVTARQGGEELSSLHESHLLQLSHISGLSYFRLEKPDSFVHLLKNAPTDGRQQIPTDMSGVPATLALLLLCIRFVPFSRAGIKRPS